MTRRQVACAAAGTLAMALLGGCTRASHPAAPRYMVGEPYSLGGLWSYPREDFALVETGLASVLPPRAAGLTANGEARDADALVAAHRTLQLPAIVEVTNLETGLALRLRVNDRGPAQAGRVIAVSSRAAALLGIPPGGAAQVRIAVDGAASRALAAGLPSQERRGPTIATAPRAEVASESLAPLAGAREAAPRAPVSLPTARTVAVDESPPPDRLPSEVTRHPPAPGRLVIEVGSFFRADLAQRRAQRLAALGAQVRELGRGRQAEYSVVLGPLATVTEADRAVAAVLAAGLSELRLVVE